MSEDQPKRVPINIPDEPFIKRHIEPITPWPAPPPPQTTPNPQPQQPNNTPAQKPSQ
jgi:hypothetical protein